MEQRKREKSSIYSYVKGRLMRLSESTYESATRAQLARLRRGAEKSFETQSLGADVVSWTKS